MKSNPINRIFSFCPSCNFTTATISTKCSKCQAKKDGCQETYPERMPKMPTPSTGDGSTGSDPSTPAQ